MYVSLYVLLQIEYTPLMGATFHGHIDIMRELITEHGANPNKQNEVSAVYVTSMYVCV